MSMFGMIGGGGERGELHRPGSMTEVHIQHVLPLCLGEVRARA